jgi:hypothetical protein
MYFFSSKGERVGLYSLILNNLSFGFFHSKIGNFSVKFRRFVLENSHLTIPFEQIYEICLETLPIFVVTKPKTQVNSILLLLEK